MTWRVQQVHGRAVLRDAAGVEDDRPVAQAVHEPEIVTDQQEGEAASGAEVVKEV